MKAIPASRCRSRSTDLFFFSLDTPKYHRLEFGSPNRFSGTVFDSLNTRVVCVGASFDGKAVGKYPADLPSEDIALHLPHLTHASRCRFDFELPVPPASRELALEALDDLDRPVARLVYDFERIRGSSALLRAMDRTLAGIPAPPPPIVLLTQGHSDSLAYQESIIPGIFNQRRYLDLSRAAMGDFRRVLDLGCGSGRSLVGWYLDDPTRELFGCDVNGELVGWARDHLPQTLQFDRTPFEPPLPYRAESFDFVNVISVFTHLSFPAQERWAREIHRVLRPGGVVCLSVHGPPYVQLFSPERSEEYERVGHFELHTRREGSNDCAAFHSPAAIRELFPGMSRIGDFPSGRIEGRRILFPLAAFQDIYVLRKEPRI